MRKTITILLTVLTLSLYSNDLLNEVKEHYRDDNYMDIISLLEGERSLSEELTYFLTESYLYSIVDAQTWMKYNSKYQDIVVKCLENDPDNILYQLNSARGMMWFPSSRGKREDGIKKILELEIRYPENIDVIYAASNYRYSQGLIEDAREGYEKVSKIDPGYKNSSEILDIIRLDEMNLTIRDITFNGNKKTPKKRLLNKIEEFKGESLNRDSRNKIVSSLREIPSINSAAIKGSKQRDFVDLEIDIVEESTKILMFQQVSGAGLDYDRDIFPSGLMPPVMIFIDNNFLGTGSKLMFITVFVYNQLKITYPGLIDDKYLDLNVDITSMLLPSENSYIDNGELIEGDRSYTYHKGKIGVGRTFPFNLSTFLYYHGDFEIDGGLDRVTQSISGEVVFNSSGSSDTPFDLQDGLSFTLIPKLNFKKSFNDSTFEEDDPSLVLIAQGGWYKNITPRNNLSLLGSWFMNINPYRDDTFRLGHKGDAVTTYSLTGYLPGEISFNNGLLLNSKYIFTPRANKVNLYGKYDLLMDMENIEFYNGVALGGAVKLPWNINLKGELGVALNAPRDEGQGYFLSIELSKLMIF